MALVHSPSSGSIGPFIYTTKREDRPVEAIQPLRQKYKIAEIRSLAYKIAGLVSGGAVVRSIVSSMLMHSAAIVGGMSREGEIDYQREA